MIRLIYYSFEINYINIFIEKYSISSDTFTYLLDFDVDDPIKYKETFTDFKVSFFIF